MKIIESKAALIAHDFPLPPQDPELKSFRGILVVRLIIAKSDKHFVVTKTKEGTLIFPSTSDGIITSYQSCGGGQDMSLQECIDLISKQDWHEPCNTHGTHVNYNSNEKSQLKSLGETLDGGGDIKKNFSISKPQPRAPIVKTHDIKDKTLQLLGQTWATDNVDDQLYKCILTSEDGLELLETWLRFYLDHYKDTNNGPVLAAIPSQCKWLQHTHTPKSFVVEAMPNLEAPVYDEDGFLIGGSNGQS
jgi:hypothetical protein